MRKRYPEKELSSLFFEENNLDIKESNKIGDFVKKLNEFYKDFKLNLEVLFSALTAKDKIDLSRFNSIPHFRHAPLAGNRFYHSTPGISFQQISSNLRFLLTINGAKTTEIDLAASSIQFLNIVLRKQGYNFSELEKALAQKDPYQYFLERINSLEFQEAHKSGEISRDSLKKMIYTLIYSLSKTQSRSVEIYLKRYSENLTYADINKEFPEFFSAIEVLKSIPIGEVNGKTCEGVVPPHQSIFREESSFVREVLKRGCLDSAIPILPLHDSFIAPAENYSDLEKIIIKASKDMYNRVLHYKKKF